MSPIERFLQAIDRLDFEAASAPLGADGEALFVTGTLVKGSRAVSNLLKETFAPVRRYSYQVIAQWHAEGIWLAELEARYELANDARISGLRRAIIWREKADGAASVHVYGAHEGTLADLGRSDGPMLMRPGGCRRYRRPSACAARGSQLPGGLKYSREDATRSPR